MNRGWYLGSVQEGVIMSQTDVPKHFASLQKRFSEVIAASEQLGKTAKKAGPLDEKTAHLVQLAAAAAIRSHGAVHSHARRALQAGASPEELYHAIIVLISTVGLPVVAAAIGWVDDIVEGS
jgi:AhpD family alkylhydroperoxidase